jgi:2-methylisocitrate lyase-like PEP mutase family enzyme
MAVETAAASETKQPAKTGIGNQARKAEHFRALHVPGKPFVLFNIWDAGSARAVTTAGASAIATSSWSVAAANGFADGERAPQSLVIDNLRRIVDATDLPVTIDLENGYGETAEAVGETIRLAIEAGAIGCNLEDSLAKNGKLRETADQSNRIRHARQVADAAKISFFINLRTDVFFQRPPAKHDESMVLEAIARARAYAQAGADGLFVPGLTDIKLITRLTAESPLPVNIMVEDTTPPLSALAQHGVARVSHGPRPFLHAMKFLEDAARPHFE